jgi:hypothetical protein
MVVPDIISFSEGNGAGGVLPPSHPQSQPAQSLFFIIVKEDNECFFKNHPDA